MAKSIISVAICLLIFVFVLPLRADEAERIYKKGEEYFNSGEYKEAIEQFSKFTQKYATNMLLPYALYNLGWSQFYVERYGDAVKNFEKLIDTFPNSDLNEDAAIAIAESLRGKKAFDEAIKAYRNFIKKYPKSSSIDRAAYGIAWAYYGKKDFKKAVSTLKKFIETYDKSFLVNDAYYFLATIYSEMGQTDEAVKTFRYLTGDKENPLVANQAYFMMGQILADSRKFGDAINFFRKVQSSRSMVGPLDEKIEYWKKRAKDSAGSLWKLARIQREIQRLGSIREKVLQQDLGAMAWYKIGLVYYQLGCYYESRVAYREVLRRFGEDPVARESKHGIILALLKQEKLDKARGAYEDFLKSFPGDSSVDGIMFYIGTILFEKGEYEDAMREYGLCLSEFPKGSVAGDCQYQVANCLLGLGEIEEARQGYRKLIKNWPDSEWVAEGKTKLAYCLFEEGKYKQALDEYLGIKKDYPQGKFMDEVIYYIGMCQFELKNYDSSIKFLSDLITRFPDSDLISEAVYKIGDNYFTKMDFARAIENYSQVEKRFPDGALADFAIFQVGMSYYYLEDYSKMAGNFERIIKKSPENEMAGEAGYWVAWNDFRNSQFDSVIEKGSWVIESFPGSDPACKTRLLLSSAFLEKGQHEDAVREYRSVLKECKSDALVDEALDGIVNICLKFMDEGEAVSEFREMEEEYSSLKDRIRLCMADYFCEKGDYDRAHKTISILKADSLSSAKYLSILGKISFKSGHYIEAVKFFEDITGKFPDSLEVEKANFYIAQCNLKMGNWSSAEEIFRKFIADCPWSSLIGDAGLGLAASLKGQKKFDKAIQLYKKIAKTHKGNIVPRALVGIGDCYFEEGNYEKALPFYLRVTILYQQFKDEAAAAYMSGGMAYEKLGKDDEASASYRELIEKFPESPLSAAAKKKISE